jgi:hypothetical protein
MNLLRSQNGKQRTIDTKSTFQLAQHLTKCARANDFVCFNF